MTLLLKTELRTRAYHPPGQYPTIHDICIHNSRDISRRCQTGLRDPRVIGSPRDSSADPGDPFSPNRSPAMYYSNVSEAGLPEIRQASRKPLFPSYWLTVDNTATAKYAWCSLDGTNQYTTRYANFSRGSRSPLPI